MKQTKNFNETKFYNKYIGKVTCAFKKDVWLDCAGKERCSAKRKQEREKYLFPGLKEDQSDKVVLIECPADILTIEMETEVKKDNELKTADRKQLDEWLAAAEENAKQLNLDCCIVSHGGTSDYLYLCNLKGLVEGNERECKKQIAKKLLPEEAHIFLDLSNLGKTLIPVMNRPHWKWRKNKLRVHKIIRGKNPNEHNNNVKGLFEVIKETEVYTPTNSTCEINDILITSVISTAGMIQKGSGEYEGSNPWHGSTHGHNFNINPSKNAWHCNRCDSGGYVSQAIAVKHGIINCEDAGRGALRGDKFLKVLEIARSDYGLKETEIIKQEPKGWAVSLNIKKIAAEKNMLNCPECNSEFKFNKLMGYFKCLTCGTFGGIKKFLKMCILNKKQEKLK